MAQPSVNLHSSGSDTNKCRISPSFLHTLNYRAEIENETKDQKQDYRVCELETRIAHTDCGVLQLVLSCLVSKSTIPSCDNCTGYGGHSTANCLDEQS